MIKSVNAIKSNNLFITFDNLIGFLSGSNLNFPLINYRGSDVETYSKIMETQVQAIL